MTALSFDFRQAFSPPAANHADWDTSDRTRSLARHLALTPPLRGETRQ